MIERESFFRWLRREMEILLFISTVGLMIRLPFFFPAVIDWDESSFIIVGQSTVDGFLPYQIAWEMKPAFVFWWFGAVIELFGKTIPAIRFAGFIWIVLSAYVLYTTAFFVTRSRLGSVFAASLLIVASSTYAQHVSAEHLALLPMAGALLVLCRGGRSLRAVFLSGILLGFACMFRLNLVYLCFVVGIFVCAETERKSWKLFFYGSLKKGVWFSAGVLAPVLLSFLPYLFSGHWRIWISVYEGAIASSEERRLLRSVRETFYDSFSGGGKIVWGAAILGAFIICRRWRDLEPERRSDWLLCGAFVTGSFLSIVMTGNTVFAHYFVQLAPGLSMFAAGAFISPGKDFGLLKADWTKFIFGAALIVIAIFRTAAAEWNTLVQRLSRNEPLSYGIEYDIAAYIRNQQIKDFSLFMTDRHLVYWLLGKYPPTRLATHPSSLDKPFIRKYVEPTSYTTEDALRSVFRREPTIFVWFPGLWYLQPADARFLRQELMSAYVSIGQIDSAKIYRRKE